MPDAAAAILTGTGAPDNADGADGDIYIQSDGTVWRKSRWRSWTDTGIDLTGFGRRDDPKRHRSRRRDAYGERYNGGRRFLSY